MIFFLSRKKSFKRIKKIYDTIIKKNVYIFLYTISYYIIIFLHKIFIMRIIENSELSKFLENFSFIFLIFFYRADTKVSCLFSRFVKISIENSVKNTGNFLIHVTRRSNLMHLHIHMYKRAYRIQET